jgi:hypothetical protein
MARIAEIQQALRAEGLDGWLFFDHHGRDPLAYRILDFSPARMVTRRWYYFVPAEGEPVAMVHKVEPSMLDALPGRKVPYAGWKEQAAALGRILGGRQKVAMQYSPRCAVPYIANVDAGTVELARATGVEVCTSANLVQWFEARWTAGQYEMHKEACGVRAGGGRAAGRCNGDRTRDRLLHPGEFRARGAVHRPWADRGGERERLESAL